MSPALTCAVGHCGGLSIWYLGVSAVELGAAEFGWHRSRRCESGNCVESVRNGDSVGLRRSVAPDAMLWLTSQQWSDFVAGVRQGEFDLLRHR